MKLSDIFESFLYGKKIRRKCWDKNLWIETSNGETVNIYLEVNKEETLINGDKKFSIDELMCEDWEFKK